MSHTMEMSRVSGAQNSVAPPPTPSVMGSSPLVSELLQSLFFNETSFTQAWCRSDANQITFIVQ